MLKIVASSSVSTPGPRLTLLGGWRSVLKKKRFEVLQLVDLIDEHIITQLKEFDDKKLVCVSEDGLELEERRDRREREKREIAEFTDQ